MESLKIEKLARAIVARNDLEARQWVVDAERSHLRLDLIPKPDLNACEMAVAAGVVELLAERSGRLPPSWTEGVGPLKEPFFVSESLMRMKRSAEEARLNGPEPLRRRNVIALPDYLTFR